MLNLESLIRKIDRLPTLPQVAEKILAIIDNPQSSARELARLVTQDPPLAGRVIKLVNSSAFGLKRPTSSIHQAILLLGFHQVRALCLGVSVFSSFDRSLRATAYKREDFWRHSVLVGYMARLLAHQAKLAIDPDQAFATGLFHDIGILVEDQFLHDDFVIILARCEQENISFAETERRLGDLDHAEIAALLLKEWKFPPDITEPVRFHHRPLEAGEYAEEAALLAAADYQCDRAGLGFAPDKLRPDPGEGIWKIVNVSAEQREESLALAMEAAAGMA